MQELVLKFGGSSVGNISRIENMLRIVADIKKNNRVKALVFSAFGKTTDHLLGLGKLAEQGDLSYRQGFAKLETFHREIFHHFCPEYIDARQDEKLSENFEVLGELLRSIYLSRELSPRFKDLILSFGERNSNYILTQVLKTRGYHVEYLDARKIIKTNNRFGGAQVIEELSIKNIQSYFQNHKAIQVVTGYISSTIDEISTTLGRGGSDYTASLIGSALGVDCIQIWTDVNGVMTANPTLVKKARNLCELNYMEAMELSHFGAKVLFPPTMIPAQKTHTPILIKNSLRPEDQGTWIRAKRTTRIENEISGITSIPQLSIMTLEGGAGRGIHGLTARLFGCISDEDLDVYLMAQGSSELSISFAIPTDHSERLSHLIEREFSNEFENNNEFRLISEHEMCAVALVGEQILYKTQIISKVFKILAFNDVGVEAIAHGSCERNLAFLIKEIDESKVLNALHDAFFTE